MGLYDSENSDANDAAYAADTQGAYAGDTSIFDTASDVVTKGIPLTGLSIVNSFANTGIELANVFGAGLDKWSVANEAPDLDQLTGQTGSAEYYQQHQQGIETAGFVLGSLIPGTLALKGLKYGTEALGAMRLAQAGESSTLLSRATGLLPSLRKAEIVNQAKVDINSSTSLYNMLREEKYRAISLGFADQALQGLVFSTATAITMKASPLTDEDGLLDTVKNITYGTIAGAGIGGLIEGIGTRATLNKILRNADQASKGQQVFDQLGKGNYAPADRVNTVLNSINNMPEATTGRGEMFVDKTRDAAIQVAKKSLAPIAEDEDPELTNSLVDVLVKQHAAGDISADDQFNTLNRLAKVQRLPSTTTPEVDTGLFYVNKTAVGNSSAQIPLNKLISSTATPAENADFTLPYALKNTNIRPNIGHAADLREASTGEMVPKFANTQDAWDQGLDLFINPKGQVLVNPKAPNIIPVPQTGESRILTQKERFLYDTTRQLPEGSEPLYGSQVPSQIGIQNKPGATIINFKTGAITNSAVPTIGDYGGVKVVNGGVEYGTGKAASFSKQDIDLPTTTSTPTVDASARFAWIAKRGFRAGDTISQDDIPALEELLRQGTAKLPNGEAPIEGMTSFQQNLAKLDKKGVFIDEIGGLPNSVDELTNMIRDAKDNQMHDLMDAHPNMSSEEIALRINTPQSYLLPNKQINGIQDFILPTSAHTDLTHGQLWYDIGSLNTQDGMVVKGIDDMNKRVQLIKDVSKSQVANFAGQDYEKLISDGKAEDADILGIGGKFLASSSSNYGTLGQSFERIGRFVSSFSQRRMAGFSQALTPAANALREDPQAAAEANMFTAIRHRTAEQFSFLPADVDHTPLGAGALGNEGKVAVLTKSILKDENGNITGWNPYYIPDGFVDASKIADGTVPTNAPGLRTFYVLSDKVANWEKAVVGVNNGLVGERNSFNAANGIQRTLPGDVLYAPPLDTSKNKFVALIKAKPGTGLADDSVHAIIAQSQEDLEAKISNLAPNYSVFTKTGDTNSIKAFHEVEGDYQFNRNFTQNRVSQDAARAGILNDVYPGTSAQELIQRQIDFFAKQNTGLIRDHVELGNAQLFAEVKALGDRFPAAATSQFGPIDPNLIKQVANPYQSYINTALNISPKEQYRTWQFTNTVAEQFFDKAFNAAKTAFSDYRSDIISAEDASKMAEQYGLGNVYGAGVDVLKNYYGIANKLPDGQFLRKFVAGANTILGTGIIRLDVYQQLIHMVSTPMLAAVEGLSAKSQLLRDMSTITLPDGSGVQMPSMAKIIFGSVKNFFKQDVHEEWDDIYNMMGADKTVIGQFREANDQLALPYGTFSNNKALDGLKKASDLMATATGSNWSTNFLHWISADIGRTIFQSAGQDGKELLDNIMTFTNRVQGNYIAGQRPVAFQGVLGQAMGLFQTFYLNLMQNAFRYVENGEGKTLALLGGLNTSLFGMQGLPGFQAINNHLVGTAAGNDNHADLYSAIGSGLGSGKGSLGDYLLYGVVSNWLDAGLYSRGDISPRSATLLPVNPLDFPAVKGGIAVVKNIIDTGNRIAQGGAVGPSLLLGLEHNGLNRPLSGLAQLAQGFATNGQGNLQGYIKGGNTGGWADMINLANFSRLLGARPLDEAVAMDAAYRVQQYTAKDEARKEALSQGLKTYLYGGGTVPSDKVEDFSAMYASSGGDQKGFSSWVMRQSTNASVPAANRLYKKLQNSPRGTNMMLQMGGQLLPTYEAPDESAPDTSTQAADQ